MATPRRSDAPAGERAHVCRVSWPSCVHSFTAIHCPTTNKSRPALSYLHEAWAEARHDASTATAWRSEPVTALVRTGLAYGEDAWRNSFEGVPARVRNGEFSLALAKQ